MKSGVNCPFNPINQKKISKNKNQRELIELRQNFDDLNNTNEALNNDLSD